jgi:hypothetical protein
VSMWSEIRDEIAADYSLHCSHHPHRVALYAAVALRGASYHRGSMWRYCAECGAEYLAEVGREESAIGLRFERSERGSWLRFRRGVDGEYSEWCTGPADFSTGTPSFDSDCGWCYLGAAHTPNEHAAKCGGH